MENHQKTQWSWMDFEFWSWMKPIKTPRHPEGGGHIDVHSISFVDGDFFIWSILSACSWEEIGFPKDAVVCFEPNSVIRCSFNFGNKIMQRVDKESINGNQLVNKMQHPASIASQACQIRKNLSLSIVIKNLPNPADPRRFLNLYYLTLYKLPLYMQSWHSGPNSEICLAGLQAAASENG